MKSPCTPCLAGLLVVEVTALSSELIISTLYRLEYYIALLRLIRRVILYETTMRMGWLEEKAGKSPFYGVKIKKQDDRAVGVTAE